MQMFNFNILSRIRQKFTNKSFSFDSSNAKAIFRLLNSNRSDVSPDYAYQLYNTSESVACSVDKIAKKTSEIMPIIKKKNGEILLEHEVLQLLEIPNSLQGYREFILSIATNYMICNNAYIEVTGFSKGKPNNLWPVKNSDVSITEGVGIARYNILSSGLFASLSGIFELDIDSGRITEPTNLKEVYHIKGFSQSTDGIDAVSQLASIAMEVEMIREANIHNLSSLKDGFNSDGVLSVKTDSIEAFNAFNAALEKRQSGSANARRILTSMGDSLDYKSFGQTNKDMEFSATKGQSQKIISNRFDIPAPLIDNSASTYNNYQTALYALYDNSIIPLVNIIFEKLTTIFRHRGMLSDDEFIAPNLSSIPALQLRIYEEIKLQSQSYVATTDELRAMIGRETIEGGDQLRIPSTLISIGTDRFVDDNPDTPTKSFIEFTDILRKNGINEDQYIEYWNDYRRLAKTGR